MQSMYQCQRKLKALKDKIKKWNKEEFDNIFEDKSHLEERIEHIQRKEMKEGYSLILREEGNVLS